MSMFGRVIMVGNLACYNQVQVIIAMKVIILMTNKYIENCGDDAQSW